MRVIGTAGHVDHGKSTLVEALSGIHPDRLKEEQEREMTIDLGFAWISLPGGEEVGIVDVPGHRDFIENMLAGIGGIDAALFVIAADEGVMPQTREHLAILDLLDIQGGVIALTKVDLVSDDEWLDLVEEEVLQVVEGTVLENAEILRVSAKTKVGLEALTYSLEAILSQVPARQDLSRPRLPIDRVFTVAGFGTVVTGTLTDGKFAVGDEIEIMPQAVKGRIRGLQSHKKKNELALPGSRTAINISGVEVDEISRGGVVMYPGQYQPTRRIDVQFRLLPDATLPVQHNDETKLFVGASEVIGRIRLLGMDRLEPGGQGWLQIELREPIICHRGDRFILRRPSPPETIGGGIILDPHPRRRYKRMHEPTLARLSALAEGDPQDILEQASQFLGIASLQAVVAASMLPVASAETALAGLIESERLVIINERAALPLDLQSDVLVSSRTNWNSLQERINKILKAYHLANPLRAGMPREELKSKLQLQTRTFSAVVLKLSRAGNIEERQSTIALPEHHVEFNAEQRAAIDKLMTRFEQAPYAPPSVKESRQFVGDDVYQALIEKGELIQLSQEVVFSANSYVELREDITAFLKSQGKLTVAQVRDRYSTSRKYVLAILEHFDALGLTVREGDYRRLRESN